MGYCDVDDAWLIALTRQRRQEARDRRAEKTVRFSVCGHEFTPSIEVCTVTTRRKRAAKTWRTQARRTGDRRCHYCEIKMENVPKHGLPGPKSCTVDHKTPLILGGDDAPENWVLACWQCNNDKGALTEGEFLAVLERRAA